MRDVRCGRREVLKAGAAVVPAWFLGGGMRAGFAAEASPNERPKVALVGCGGMGTGDAKNAERFGDIVAVCDLDEGHLARARENFTGAHGYKDFREVCDRPDIDAVINGTPDHWHTLVNLRAVKSGKDIYSEKPLTLTIDEGKRLVAAVKQTGRVLQTGSQQRSDAKFRLACELVRGGRLGKVRRVDVWLPAGFNEGPFPPEPVPAGLDWEFWQGQSAAADYTPKRCHVFFRYWYDYSGGTMTDWGAHHNDIALWGLGRDRGGPVSVEGRPLVDQVAGGYTAASRYEVRYVYDDGVEHVCRSTTSNNFDGSVAHEPGEGDRHHGVRFEGPEGWVYVTRGKIEASDPKLLEEPAAGSDRLSVSDDHMGNFFDCVKSRKAPICDAEIGHRSASVCHLGVIAIRLGRKLEWDPAKETFVGDDEANGMLAREQRRPYSYDEFA